MNTLPLTLAQYQIVRDAVKEMKTVAAYVTVRGELTPVTIVEYSPFYGQHLIVECNGRRSRPLPFADIRVDEATAASLTQQVEARESSRAMAQIYALHARHGRTLDGRFADALHRCEVR